MEGIDVLLTLDVKHLANDRCREQAEIVAAERGYSILLEMARRSMRKAGL